MEEKKNALQDKFLRELKELFHKYDIKIGHSLDYDYNDEICADEPYLYNDFRNAEPISIPLAELETKLKAIKINVNRVKREGESGGD